MPGHCECGMTLDQPSISTSCQDCGSPCCRSCAIEIDSKTFCRWCATWRARLTA